MYGIWVEKPMAGYWACYIVYDEEGCPNSQLITFDTEIKAQKQAAIWNATSVDERVLYIAKSLF